MAPTRDTNNEEQKVEDKKDDRDYPTKTADQYNAGLISQAERDVADALDNATGTNS